MIRRGDSSHGATIHHAAEKGNSYTSSARGIHLMAKPAGPTCNLRCKYCFYLEKEALFPKSERYRMSDEILEAYIRGCSLANLNAPSGIIFAWQGGEPTLMGLDFFKKALELEKRYSRTKPFTNTLQTNGILLDDRWCEFLAKNKFLVGLSLDGPAWIHNLYRIDAKGQPTHAAVMRALRLLQKHGVEHNILACVAKETAKHPLQVYNFFKEEGVKFIQFLPIVERMPDSAARRLGLRLAPPPALDTKESQALTPWTVEPEALGDFYISIFDEWVRQDVGRIFIMNFEWTLHSYLGGDGPVCYLSKRCGTSCILEHNGDIYSCDHFVYPEFRLGNILVDDVKVLVESAKQYAWGCRKENTLTAYCRKCDEFFICRGGCPKHRFAESLNGELGSNYLCAAYKKFYRHTKKYMAAFRKLIENDLPCEYIMQAVDRPLVVKNKPDRQSVMIWIK
jgi:uncharacterized protein